MGGFVGPQQTKLTMKLVLYKASYLDSTFAYLCISPAVPRSPLHVNMAMVVITVKRSTLVRNIKRKTDWYGGNRARADFHVSPFGNNIVM